MIINEQVCKDIVYNVLTKNGVELDNPLMETVCTEIAETLLDNENEEEKKTQDIVANRRHRKGIAFSRKQGYSY